MPCALNVSKMVESSSIFFFDLDRSFEKLSESHNFKDFLCRNNSGVISSSQPNSCTSLTFDSFQLGAPLSKRTFSQLMPDAPLRVKYCSPPHGQGQKKGERAQCPQWGITRVCMPKLPSFSLKWIERARREAVCLKIGKNIAGVSGVRKKCLRLFLRFVIHVDRKVLQRRLRIKRTVKIRPFFERHDARGTSFDSRFKVTR